MSTPTMQDVADLLIHVEDLEARIEELEADAGLQDNGDDEYDDVQPKFVGEASAFEHADPDTLHTLADAIEEIREAKR